jgi:hypothetical protein
MPLLIHTVVGPLAGDSETVELPGESTRETSKIDHLLDLALAFAERLPGFQGDQ